MQTYDHYQIVNSLNDDISVIIKIVNYPYSGFSIIWLALDDPYLKFLVIMDQLRSFKVAKRGNFRADDNPSLPFLVMTDRLSDH